MAGCAAGRRRACAIAHLRARVGALQNFARGRLLSEHLARPLLVAVLVYSSGGGWQRRRRRVRSLDERGASEVVRGAASPLQEPNTSCPLATASNETTGRKRASPPSLRRHRQPHARTPETPSNQKIVECTHTHVMSCKPTLIFSRASLSSSWIISSSRTDVRAHDSAARRTGGMRCAARLDPG
jgi:hypothetical protein